jgi:hypothetical protein
MAALVQPKHVDIHIYYKKELFIDDCNIIDK